MRQCVPDSVFLRPSFSLEFGRSRGCRVINTGLFLTYYFSKTTDAAIIMNQEGFDNLDHSMQRFVAALSRGQTALQNLIAEESISIKAHVTGETEKLRQGIKEDISTRSRKFDDTISSAVEAAQKFQAERQEGERLLKSLNYPGKDSRRDQIENAHHQTFEWIFSSITDESTDVSGGVTMFLLTNIQHRSPFQTQITWGKMILQMTKRILRRKLRTFQLIQTTLNIQRYNGMISLSGCVRRTTDLIGFRAKLAPAKAH